MFRKKISILIRFSLLALMVLVVTAPAAGAEDWTGVLEKIKDKYASYDKKVKDLTLRQEIFITTGGREMTSDATLYKKGNMFRMDSSIEIEEMPKEMGPVMTVVIHDGQHTWMISSMMGKQQLTAADQKQYQAAQDWWTHLDENATITGTETVEGRECYVVAVENTETVPYSVLWIDKKDLVMVKGQTGMSKTEKIDMIFSEFKTVEKNWLVPHKTDMYLNGELISTVKVVSLETNQGVMDDLFDVDKVEIKGPSMQDMMKMMQGGGD